MIIVNIINLLSFQTNAEKYLLAPVLNQDLNKKCVVIDLDETLVHSSFKVSLYTGQVVFNMHKYLPLDIRQQTINKLYWSINFFPVTDF